MPKESLLEFQAWKASERKQQLLLAGLPLPPELLLDAPEGPLRLEAAPAGGADAATGGAAAGAEAPSAPAAAPAQKPRRRCALRMAGVTRAEFLAQLDAACAIDWGESRP